MPDTPTLLPTHLSGDEEVRHPREVRDDRLAVNVDAERDREERRRAPESFALDDLAERDQVTAAVRNLDPDRGAARHALDADFFGRQREREVVLEGRDLRDFHAADGLNSYVVTTGPGV